MGEDDGTADEGAKGDDGATGEAHSRLYRDGVLESENIRVDEISNYLHEEGTLVWVDYLRPTKEQLDTLADELGLHELAIEDALKPHQRPKLDVYESHLFLSCRAVRVDPDQGRLIESEVSAFANSRWLVTVRHDDELPVAQMRDRLSRSPELASGGASFLLYGLLDAVVDEYFDVVQAFDDYYDEVSEGIFLEHPLEPAEQRHWFEMRRALVRFHRVAVPMREALSSLMRREQSVVTPELYPYYQDVYDHLLRVSEATDSLRDLVSTIVDTNISLRDYHQNQIMKKVTSWAAIVAVPTLITGFYGMNVPYPGFARHWGATASVVLMLALSLGLYIQFKRRDWL